MLPRRSETPSPFIDSNPPQALRHFASQRFQGDEYEQDDVPLFPSSQPERTLFPSSQPERLRRTDAYRPQTATGTGHRVVAQSPLVPQRNLSHTASMAPLQSQYTQFSTMEEHQPPPPSQSQTVPQKNQTSSIIRDTVDRIEHKVAGLVESMQANRDALHDLKTSLRALPTREEVREEVQETVAQSLADVVSSLTTAVQNAVQPLVKTTSGIAAELEKVKTAVSNLSSPSGGSSSGDGEGTTARLLEVLIDRLKPMDELKDALHNIKDLPQAIIAVTTFADAVSLLKTKVADGLREHEASLTPPATQARRASEDALQGRQNRIAPTASSATLNWLSQPQPPTPASLATPPSPAIAELAAIMKVVHDDLSYLKVAGLADVHGTMRKLNDVVTAQAAAMETAAENVAELRKGIDAIEVVAAARKSGEGASSLDPAPVNVPATTTTLKRKAPVRKPKAEPFTPELDSIEQIDDVFGPVVPNEAEGPANKKKKAAPKKRAATTAAPKKAPARAATTAKKAPARSATTTAAARAKKPVIVLDSDDSLESRSPDTPDNSPLASVNDNNVIPLDVDVPVHVTRSVVRRLSSPAAPTSSRVPLPMPRSSPAVPNLAVANASGSNLPPARPHFARLASPDEEDLDEAAMDAQIGIF
ncbi:uncharacterized protein LOC62_04G005435 [Vanrija pseudolonga]|uniref:Uncharacterized protein n=1 Tax=Vanrija pseudolonga TaxID=143232 RepID=A0AAF0YE97_9TREE|nr:hypothetical protein LOC62_04G005435 [Vanrija pseudolonga]